MNKSLPFFALLAISFVSSAARADVRVFGRHPDRQPPAPPAAAEPVVLPAAEPSVPSAGSTDAAVSDSAASDGTEPASDGTAPASDAPAAPAPSTPSTPVAPASGPRDEHSDMWLDLTGFVQPGFIARIADSNAASQDSTFWLQRARLGIRAQVTSFLRMRVELELSPTPSLQDAYVDLVANDALQFRAGQFLVPFLLAYQFNEVNLGFLDRPIYTPLAPDRPFIRFLSPRDIGAMVFGRVGNRDPQRRSPTFEYSAGAFLGRGANQNQNNDEAFLLSARAQLHLFGRPVGAEAESDLARNLIPRVAVGTAFYSNCDDRTNWNRGFTVDLETRYRGFYASGAVVWFRSGPSLGVGNALGYDEHCSGSYLDAAGMPTDFVSRGAHFQAQYVLPHAVFPVENQAIEVMARYDIADPVSPFDPDRGLTGGGSTSQNYIVPGRINDSDNAPTQWRLTFGLNYFPNNRQTLRVGLNYQLNREAETIMTAAGPLVGVRNDAVWIQITAGL